MRLFLALLLFVALGIGGFIYYLQQKLEPVMTAKGVELNLTPYKLTSFTGSTRQIDLGFARFNIPATISGEPMLMGDTLFIVLEQGALPIQISFFPPISEQEKEVLGLVTGYLQVSGERVDNSFEYKKRALLAQPFSVWAIPALGKRKAISTTLLLLTKSLLAHAASKLQVFETTEVGLLIVTDHNKTVITLFDKRKQITQDFYITHGSVDIDQFLAAVIPSYKFISDDTVEAKWHEQAKAAGLRSKTTTVPNIAPLPDTERLSKIQEEIRRRRNFRQQGDK
jgi:hypothetical protein